MDSRKPLLPDETRDSYLDPATLPYAFCPGCSHARIVDQLNAALVSLQLDPQRTVLVSDIGCAGIADKYFATHAFHALHGRSITYATGIKLADPSLNVIVLIGDGGCGIGGHHLLNAARRNIGITVLVFNNLNFGMTGGQYSVTTLPGSVTPTTPQGHLERPLDIAGTAAVNGAGFVARTTAFDPDLPALISRAIRYDGFSVVDIWELCVAYYVPANEFNRQALEDAMTAHNADVGILREEPRPEYSRAYRDMAAHATGDAMAATTGLPPIYESQLRRPLSIVIAGSAGQRIRTAGTLLATGAVLSGLWATRRDDYPITVRSGYSIAEVTIGPEPITYTGVSQPDAVVVLAEEGAARMREPLTRMTPEGRVFVAGDVEGIDTPARRQELAFPSSVRTHARKSLATLAVAELVRSLDLYPLAALEEAARRTQREDIAEMNVAAISALLAAVSEPPGDETGGRGVD